MARSSSAFRQSLSLRLLSYAGAAFAAALVAAWLILGLLFERHLERQLQTELERQGLALIASLELPENGPPHLKRALADSRYARPASGLYWQISGPSGALRSRSLWDADLPNSQPFHNGESWQRLNAKGPYEPEILSISRTVQLSANGAPLQVNVAADREAIASARRAFGLESAIFMAILWAALSLAAWVQVKMGLRPLTTIRSQLAIMSRSPDGRLPQEAQLNEIRPLTDAINDLAHHRQQDIHRARQRARDLAHALKTPMTALRLQIDALPPQQAQGMAQSLSLLTGAVEAELARTGVESNENAKTAIAPLITRLLSVLKRTPDGANLHFEERMEKGLTLPLSEEAAFETFGALLENAVRHSRSVVRVTGTTSTNETSVMIDDDGKGIPEEWRAAALGRGISLDQRGNSHGLGLSIAQDFVTASGGALTLTASDLGGLRVTATWPQ